MGTDSFMELLKSDLNGLSTNNPLVTERIYGEIDEWYTWACHTLAKHGSELEVQVIPAILARTRISGDVECLRKLFNDPICTRGAFTPLGERLHEAYTNLTRQTIQAHTLRCLRQDRRKRMRVLVAPTTTQQIISCAISLATMLG